MNTRSTKSQMLICWKSERAGAEVLINSLQALKNRGIPITEVLYLVQRGKAEDNLVLPAGVAIRRFELSVTDPTEHETIYALMRNQVLPLIRQFANTSLHVNISPGTPAMHAVWLILHAGGLLPSETKLWSSQRNPDTKRTSIHPVQFPISTYLSEIHRGAELNPGLAEYEPDAKSPARRQALDMLARYARVPGAPLLILGERGTGKTRLVETLVARIKLRKKVVSVPCGGLDSELAESFLFGHRKGAFTGAQSDRPGALKEADGGILFLDEVQDLPQTAQRKLVRVFQDFRQRFRPLGSDREKSVKLELVCASNLSLGALRKKLDSDFFDRLSYLVVTLPPLRDCREDLSDDWERVWRELRHSKYQAAQTPWPESLRQTLEQHPLPGNLRDLQRLAYLMMAWSNGENTMSSWNAVLADWRGREVNEESGALYLGTGSRGNRLDWFKRELACWGKQQFGTWLKAAQHLECDEKTLRDDASD